VFGALKLGVETIVLDKWPEAINKRDAATSCNVFEAAGEVFDLGI
jgi:hypothetical protein